MTDEVVRDTEPVRVTITGLRHLGDMSERLEQRMREIGASFQQAIDRQAWMAMQVRPEPVSLISNERLVLHLIRAVRAEDTREQDRLSAEIIRRMEVPAYHPVFVSDPENPRNPSWLRALEAVSSNTCTDPDPKPKKRTSSAVKRTRYRVRKEKNAS